MIQNDSNELLITPHKQSIGYNKSKNQTKKKSKIEKKQQKTNIKRKFSKTGNALSEPDTINITSISERLNR